MNNENEAAKLNERSKKIKDTMPDWVASLGVAAMIIIALQLTFVFQPTPDESIDAELLETLPSAVIEPHWMVNIAFEPMTPWSSIIKTLTAANGTIIDGPSSTGFIRVAVPKEPSQFEDPQMLLEWLKAQANVVTFSLDDV